MRGRDGRVSGPRVWGGLFTWSLATVLGAVMSQPAAADKVLYDFEQPEQLTAWGDDAERSDSRKLSLEAPEITAGDKALKIVFTGQGSEWPGIAISDVPRDWSGHEALKFEVTSVNPLSLGVRIDDAKSTDHRTRFGANIKLEQRKTLVQIPMESIARTIDPSDVRLFCLFLTKPPAGTTIYIDNIRLGPIEAQKVEYIPFEQRKDAPLTDAVETPVAWRAKPLPGGPIHLFAIPSIQYGRELVELAQRLDITYGLVTWDRSWGQNTWGLGDHYGQRGHRFDFKDVQNYLSMELAGPNEYDVYVIRTPVGWKWFPKAARQALLERVEDGAGLVLIQPYSGAEDFDASDLWSISPLTDCKTDTMEEPGGDMQEPAEGLIIGQDWKAVEPDHPIAKGLPLDLLPYKAMAYQQYKVAPDAKVIIKSDIGDPIVAVKQYGKGRVVTCAWRPFDMTPQVNHPGGKEPPVDYAYWEVGYNLVARCVQWAAGREVSADLPDSFVKEARNYQANPVMVQLPDSVPTGQPIQVMAGLSHSRDRWTLTSAELQDTYGRTLARADFGGETSLELPSDRVSTPAAKVIVEAVDGEGNRISKTGAVVLQPPHAAWNDYEVIMWPNDRLPWHRSVIYEQMRQWGCTATLDPQWRDFDLMRERLVNGMRIVPHGVRRQLLQINPDRFAIQKQQYELTKDKKYLERFLPISDERVRGEEVRQMHGIIPALAKLRPLAYCIGEEDSLTSYRAELDIGFAPATLAKFREHMKEKYNGDLAALNGRWDTSFASWDEVTPMAGEEAKAHGNFAPWAEHRSFMDDEWADIYFFYLDLLRKLDNPQVLMGTSGTQVPTPHDGQDWYKLMPAMNWLSSYTYGHQDEMHMNFADGKPYITAATGYGVSADRARHLLWNRLFHGNAGAIIFWWIAIQNPDLSFCQAGKDLGAVIGELKEGAGRLVFEADRQGDPIAVHYSIPSMQAGYITTGGMNAYESAVDAWWVALQELGYQPVFVSSQQIEQGKLQTDGFKALVMPRSVALGDVEKQKIDEMVAAGGAVVGSQVDVGIYDTDLARRSSPLVPAGYRAMDPAAQKDSLAAALAVAGIDPVVKVVSRDGAALSGMEVVRYQLDDMLLIGILREPAGVKQVVGPDGVIRFEPDPTAGRPVEPVGITMPYKAPGVSGGQPLVYNVRTHEPLEAGLEDGQLKLDVDLPAGDATLLAVLPGHWKLLTPDKTLQRYEVKVPEQVARGEDLRIGVTWGEIGRRVVRLEVRRPDGSDAPWLTRNLLIKGEQSIEAAVALDEQAGEWTVTATDVVTGMQAKGTFEVTEPTMAAAGSR